jgi:hypothetical protein
MKVYGHKILSKWVPRFPHCACFAAADLACWTCVTSAQKSGETRRHVFFTFRLIRHSPILFLDGCSFLLPRLPGMRRLST